MLLMCFILMWLRNMFIIVFGVQSFNGFMIVNGFNFIVCDGRVLNLFILIFCNVLEIRMIFIGLWVLGYIFYYIRKYIDFYISKLIREFQRWENKKRKVIKYSFRMIIINSLEVYGRLGQEMFCFLRLFCQCWQYLRLESDRLKQYVFFVVVCVRMYLYVYYYIYLFMIQDFVLF